MSTKSSAGTVPDGVQLYSFEYPHQVDFIGRPEHVFFLTEEAAREFAKEEGAVKIIHALSGKTIALC